MEFVRRKSIQPQGKRLGGLKREIYKCWTEVPRPYNRSSTSDHPCDEVGWHVRGRYRVVSIKAVCIDRSSGAVETSSPCSIYAERDLNIDLNIFSSTLSI